MEDIAEKVKTSNFKPPAVAVVGGVVSLREKLRWFDTRPLFGKRIVVTRAREQASDFAEILERGGLCGRVSYHQDSAPGFMGRH